MKKKEESPYKIVQQKMKNFEWNNDLEMAFQ